MWPFRRSQKQVGPTAVELLNAIIDRDEEKRQQNGEATQAEIEAQDHEKLKSRRTLIHLKSGCYLIIRGASLNMRGIVTIRSKWDSTCAVWLAVPWSSIDFIASDEVSDKPPETSIEYRTTLPEGMLPKV